MTTYTTEPIIKYIIKQFEQLEIKPATNKARDEIDNLICDILDEVRHIHSLLFEVEKLEEMKNKTLNKKAELDEFVKNNN